MNERMQQPLQRVRERWQALGARERRLLGFGMGVVLLFLIWWLALQPALRTLREAPAQLDSLDQQLQTMQRLAAEARELREATPINTEQALQALKSASERLGAQARLNVQGERAVLTLNGVDSGSLRQWLAEVRSGARARALEAQLNRGASGYSGTVVLAVGGAP